MKNATVVLLILAITITGLAIQARVSWDGSDTYAVAGGLVIIDAYTGLVSVHVLNVEYCPFSANCQFDK
jgi:hypothetical protein